MDARDVLLAIVIVTLGIALVYFLDPTFGGLIKTSVYGFPETFIGHDGAEMTHLPGTNVHATNPVMPNISGALQETQVYGSSYAVDNVASASGLSPADSGFGAAESPQNCYPKKQLKASELLPNDPNSQWVQANPLAPGSIMDKNFLNAGYQIGVDTVGQSMRNASYDLRSSPPNPQLQVGPWMQSTIEPDINRKPLEIGA
jgi:hypothetical protein